MSISCATSAPLPLTGGGGPAPAVQSPIQAPVPAPSPVPPVPVQGGGPTLAAAIGQVQAAVADLSQVLATMTPVSGGGGPAGCSMPGCSTSGGGGAYAAPTAAPVPAAAATSGTPATPPQAAPVTGARGGALSATDAQVAQRIDSQLLEGTGLAGKGSVIVAAARQYDVPLDFVLAIYQKEGSFARSGTLADRNNNPGNLRFAEWEKEHGGVPNGGFTKFPTMDDGIRASVHLLARDTYRDAVARRDWGAVIARYAPSFENDTATYVKQMNEWTASIRSKIGIDENWVRQR